jgi:hypothetical protein
MSNTSSNRNRSSGWSYAKRDGHDYEDKFAIEVKEGQSLYKKLCNVAGIPNNVLPVDATTSHDRPKPLSVFGDHTTSKTDVTVYLRKGGPLDISVKKPSTKSGQVLLCRLDRFVKLIEKKTGRPIPQNAIWALKAFFGETDGIKILEFAPKVKFTGPIIKKHRAFAEIYQNRLYASTLSQSYPKEWYSLQSWFRSNINEITDCCFRSGFCSDEADERSTAEYVYVGCLARFFTVASISKASEKWEIIPSSNGYYKGSTIIMPWGFLQGHRPGEDSGPYQVQFHWRAKDIVRLLA